EASTLSRGIFVLRGASESELLNAFAVLVYPSDFFLSRRWSVFSEFSEISGDRGTPGPKSGGVYG
ncbi:MAG: hypothetical protein K2P41_13150, partial [Lachnospiraceae bacterium]|nr:hypothetical protein [Lachnospiraceae bacterium]